MLLMMYPNIGEPRLPLPQAQGATGGNSRRDLRNPEATFGYANNNNNNNSNFFQLFNAKLEYNF